VEVSKGLKEELANPGRELLRIVKLPRFPTRVGISIAMRRLLSSTAVFCLETVAV